MDNDLDMRWYRTSHRVGLLMEQRGSAPGRWVALIDTRDLELVVCNSHDRPLYELDARDLIPHTLTDLGEVKALAEFLIKVRHAN